MASYTFIPLLAKSIGASMAEIGVIGATFFIVTTPMMYVLGKLSDLRGLRKWFIISGFIGASAVYFFLAISNSVLQLGILMIVLGLSASAYQPSILVLVSEPSPRFKIGAKMGFFFASLSAGFGVGVISGGVLGDIFGLSWVFFLCGIILIFGLLAIIPILKKASLKEGKGGIADSPSNVTREIRLSLVTPRSFSAFIDSPIIKTGVLFLCITIFLRNSGFRGLTTFLPLYLVDLGASNSLMGMIVSLNFILQVFFMPPAGWLSDFIGRKITISIGILSSCIAMLLFSVINNPYSAIPIQILVAFSWSLIITSTNAYVADFIPMNKRGGGMGLIRSSQTLGGAVGPMLAGLFINFFGYRIMLRSLILLPLLGSIISITKLKK